MDRKSQSVDLGALEGINVIGMVPKAHRLKWHTFILPGEKGIAISIFIQVCRDLTNETGIIFDAEP